MIRLIPLFFIVVVVLGVVVVNPRMVLRLGARLRYWVASGISTSHSVPEWVAYYLWTAPGDPTPPGVSEMEGSVRMLAILMLIAPLVLVLIVVLSGP